ncbi:MAG: hypothetical protein E6G60_06805 [Actinobacteria bacterium]|nr:MAG: hypothetical protein E6G60_06805 [Actinomycetota bacterium]
MDRHGGLDLDLGYWAQRWDPTGALHPLHYTQHMGHRWVNATTLPMLVVAYPLYELGGERAALLIPMLAAVLAALAARALARRLVTTRHEQAGWWAFWATGLVTPVAIYALDFWEHAAGIALMLWAVVFLVDVATQRAGWRGACAAGVLFGAAATMRTEAFVYGAVAGAVALAVLAHRTRRLAPVLQAGAVAMVGAVVPLGVNQLLERALLGSSLRAARAAATAGQGGGGLRQRAEEALTTTVGLNRYAQHTDWLIGIVVVGLVAVAAVFIVRARSVERRLGILALGIAFIVYLVAFGRDLGFVPGLLTASPLAAAGVALAWRESGGRIVGAMAVGALPLVWGFQFLGGANPQWGGRYALVSGALLAIAAVAVFASRARVEALLVGVLAAAVTATGVAWLSVRSHGVASAMEHVVARPEAVVVSRLPHLLREGGAFMAPDQHWLTAPTEHRLMLAAGVARDSGAGSLAVVDVDGGARPVRIGDYLRTGRTERFELFPGLDLQIVRYVRSGP